MRYDKTIKLVLESWPVYDEETGDYTANQNIEVIRSADVTDMGMKTMTFLFGGLQEGAKTVRLKGPYKHPVSYIDIDGNPYIVKLERRLRGETIFEVVSKQ